MRLLELAAVVFGVNLLPAFGPPTWTLLVYFSVRHNEPAAAVVAIGVVAACSGRTLLALGCRRLRHRLPAKFTARLDAARAAVTQRRGRTIAGVALFALSPLPSGQLFSAAGLMDVSLPPLVTAFFAGRVVSYTLYVTLAHVAQRNLGSITTVIFGSWWSILVEVVLLALVSALPFVKWRAPTK